MLRVGTGCSGIGAPEQSLKNLGVNHKVEFAIELDKFSRETYQANFDIEPEFFYTDITQVNTKELPDIDLFIAGFPCQAFSIAGNRKGFEDTRGTIFFDCLRILKEKKPKYFILENVKGLLSHDSGKTFESIINSLAKTVNGQLLMFPNSDGLNYNVYYKVINAKDHKVPQNRERIFIVGFRDDNHVFNFPKKEKLGLRLKDILEPEPDQKYYLNKKSIDYLLRQDKSGKNKLDRNYHNFSSAENSQCLTANYSKGIPYNVLIENENIKSDKILQLNNPIHSNNYENKIRRLTPLECKRLMGFPDNFKMPVSDTQKYKQCGNSIVVNVMEDILREVLKNESKT